MAVESEIIMKLSNQEARRFVMNVANGGEFEDFDSDLRILDTDDFYILNGELFLLIVHCIDDVLKPFYESDAIAVPSGDLNTLRLVLETMTMDLTFNPKNGLYKIDVYEVEL